MLADARDREHWKDVIAHAATGTATEEGRDGNSNVVSCKSEFCLIRKQISMARLSSLSLLSLDMPRIEDSPIVQIVLTKPRPLASGFAL